MLSIISLTNITYCIIVFRQLQSMFQRWYELNFQVTNTSPDACQMSFNSLLLQEENSNHAPYQATGPGRDNYVTLQAKQSVPTSPYLLALITQTDRAHRPESSPKPVRASLGALGENRRLVTISTPSRCETPRQSACSWHYKRLQRQCHPR